MGAPSRLATTSSLLVPTASECQSTDHGSTLGRFLTADDDWIARHQDATMILLWVAVLIVPGVIEWMI